MSEVYAYKNIDEEVLKSSSGGAFIALCEAFEKLHGKGNVAFYGAAFDENLNVKHLGVLSLKECKVFQGSKYVRSECNYIFSDIEEKINLGYNVLFSGIPCQIYAIKAYLTKRNISLEKIVLVEVICHGTPRKELWSDYKKWLEKKAGAKLIKYSFRYKPQGWKAYPVYAEFDSGKKIINTAETSVFSKMHMARYSIEKGCFSCPFAKEDRNSDITLGDYWGIERILPKFPNKIGVSLILSNTDKGNIIVEKLNCNGVYLEKTQGKEYLKYQHNLIRPTEKPESYDEFWADYKNIGFEGVLKKYIGYGKKYKINYTIKKIVRKTPLITIYRNYKLNKIKN